MTQIKSNTDQYLVLIILNLFAFFLFIPNSFKGIPVISLIFISLYFFLKKPQKIQWKRFILTGPLIFFSLLVTLIYTDNIDLGWKKIETCLSLLIIPFAFYVLNFSQRITNKHKSYFINMFIHFSAAFCIVLILLMYCDNETPYWEDFRVNKYRTVISNLKFVNIHPIYASYLVGFSVLFLVNKIFYYGNNIKSLILNVIEILVMGIFLLMLSSRIVIISVLLTSAILILFSIKKKKFRIGTTILFLIITVLIFSFNRRFNEIFVLKNYEENYKTYFSVNHRLGIIACDLQLIKENWLVGVGIGDQYTEIEKCLISKNFLSKRYNSHNQFLSYIINAGVLGLSFFILFLFFYYKTAHKQNNILLLTTLIYLTCNMMFENLLERQDGIILTLFILNVLANTKPRKALLNFESKDFYE